VELTAFRIVTLEEASHQARGLATFTPTVWKEIGSTPKGHLAKNVVFINHSRMEYDAMWLGG
jgi:hypothetical protein